MNAVSLLLAEVKSAHQYLEMTMDGVTNDVANKQPEGTANSIAATYAHIVAGEDMMVHGMLQQKQPLSAGEWKEKTGLSEPHPGGDSDWSDYPAWTKRVTIDVTKTREFAKAVYAATESYISSLKDEDLDKEMEAWGMKMNLGEFLGNMIVGHVNSIMGEIAVLKGIQGLKGYPF